MATQDELKKQVGYKAVDDYVKSYIATLGENIQVARFVRFNLGETAGQEAQEEAPAAVAKFAA